MQLPFSSYMRHGDLIYTSGQGPVQRETGTYTPGDIQSEARLTLHNLQEVLREAGSSMEDVLRVTVYLASMQDYAAFNAVYREFFHPPLPARSCIAASGLAFGMKVELDAIARVKGR